MLRDVVLAKLLGMQKKDPAESFERFAGSIRLASATAVLRSGLSRRKLSNLAVGLSTYSSPKTVNVEIESLADKSE